MNDFNKLNEITSNGTVTTQFTQSLCNGVLSVRRSEYSTIATTTNISFLMDDDICSQLLKFKVHKIDEIDTEIIRVEATNSNYYELIPKRFKHTTIQCQCIILTSPSIVQNIQYLPENTNSLVLPYIDLNDIKHLNFKGSEISFNIKFNGQLKNITQLLSYPNLTECGISNIGTYHSTSKSSHMFDHLKYT